MLIPHSHQEAAISSAYEWLFRPNAKPGLVVVPVGGGKSLIMAELIKRISLAYPRTKIISLTHVQELIQQNVEHLIRQCPEADICIYSAGLGSKRLHSDIVFAGIQSVYNKIADFARCPSIILIDEAHLISHNSETMYRQFLNDIVAINPNARILGFTGTPFRADTGRLDEGDGRLFDEIIYQIELKYLIDNDYLCRPVTPENSVIEMDVTGVGTRKGDYIESQLQKAVDKQGITGACVDEIIRYGANRKQWLVFTAGVQHCLHVMEEIKSRGITAAMVTGKTPPEERAQIFADYKAGKTRCLVNVGVATTGFNVPAIDMIALMRPTRSPVLYMQMAGRGLRLSPGKEDCLFLDFGGVIRELGPLDAIDIRKRASVKDPDDITLPVTKICPACTTVCMGGQKYCYSCGYQFPMGMELDREAEKKQNMLTGLPEKRPVIRMTTAVHKSLNKPDGPTSMRVDYDCLGKRFSEWVCFNHQGFAREKAVIWHNRMRPDIPPPATVEEAVNINYPKPDEIEVRQEGKYWRVMNVVLSERAMENLSLPEGIDDYEEILF